MRQQEGQHVAGRLPVAMRRRPRVEEEGRICSVESCKTRLTRYNLRDHCFHHQSVHFRRPRS